MADGLNRGGGFFGLGAAIRKQFGFKLDPEKKSPKKDDSKKEEDPKAVSFTPPLTEDGGIVISGEFAGGMIDLDTQMKSEVALISKYRSIALAPEIETAVDDIVNEAIIYDEDEMPLKIDFDDDSELDDKVKEKISEAFDKVLRLYDVKNRIYEIFRRWYIDSRLYYNIIVDPNKLKEGIVELRFIDPLFMTKVTKIESETSPVGIPLITDTKEFYIFDNTNQQDAAGAGQGGMGQTTPPRATTTIDQNQEVTLAINANAIIYVPSGLYDHKNKRVLGYLHKAIRPLNQLQMVEDAIVIYRLSRAPERRVFYIDVGNLPKSRAEQYMRSQMNRFRNRMIYDSTTGEIRDDKRFLSMLEDYWLPRREGGRGTEITTLPGGQNLGQLEDVQYFLKKLYKALNVPFSRYDDSAGSLSASRSSEIMRDELKFGKFVSRLRKKFADIFIQALRIECILTGVIEEDEWSDIEQQIQIYFIDENSYKETKSLEVLRGRFDALDQIKPLIGKYYSHEWVRKNILRMTDPEIKEMDKQIEKEKTRGDIQSDEEMY